MLDSDEEDMAMPSFPLRKLTSTPIVQVWRQNLEAQILRIGALVNQFNVIGMDTEFPGTCYLPNIHFYYNSTDESENQYQLISENVCRCKIIQLGLSLANSNGEVPDVCCWQFNFEFDLEKDKISPDSQGLLERAGIDFKELKTRGIKPAEFAQLMTASGVVLNDDVKWVVFHGGYDFAYLLQLLLGSLPTTVQDFYTNLRIFFPTIYDLKYLIKETNLKDVGLNKLGNQIHCERIGAQHQAGSDSLLTLACHFRLEEQYPSKISFQKMKNVIFGIGSGYVPSHEYKQTTTLQTPVMHHHHQPQTTWQGEEFYAQYDQQAVIDYMQQIQQMQGLSYDLYNSGYNIYYYLPQPEQPPKDKKK